MRVAATALAMLLAACGPAERAPPMDEAANEAAYTAPAPPAEEARRELADAGAPESEEAKVSACLTQDGERIGENAIRAIGTEPFWGARVEGRCVTYSTPEDQDGTRIWTKFSGSADNGRWSGALDGQPFVMVTRPQENCSDGMSDNVYPIAVGLTVRGEQRTGCAEPL